MVERGGGVRGCELSSEDGELPADRVEMKGMVIGRDMAEDRITAGM